MRQMCLVVLFSLIAATLPISAAPKATLTVALSPASAVAGSSDNTLTFSFTAADRSEGEVVVVVPAPVSGQAWSAPQAANPLGAGFVDVQSMGCQSASLASITGSAPGPWSVSVNHRCAPKKSFVVAYRATAAATRADNYQFTTTIQVGRHVLPADVQPIVTVVGGAAATLDLTGLASAPAGTAQTPVLTAFDTYGNVATGYVGTVSFTSDDDQALLPAEHTFTAANAGSASFAGGVILKTAGSRTVTAADAVTASLSDAQLTAVSPGATSELRMHLAARAIAFNVISFGSCGVAPFDAYGNYTPDYTGTLRWSSSDTAAQLPVTGQWSPLILNGCAFHTEGSQTVTVNDDANSLTASGAITVLGPVAVDDEIKVLNPIHFARITRPALSPLVNDSFGVLATPIITSVGQIAHETPFDGTFQIGVTSVSDDGTQVIWDLYPPEGATATDPDMELRRCAFGTLSGGVCFFDNFPLAMEYLATDGINSATGTVALTIDTPTHIPIWTNLNIEPVPPYMGAAGFVPTSGFLIPITVNLTATNVQPHPTIDGVFSMTVSGNLCDPDDESCTVSRFETTALVTLPSGFVSSGGVYDLQYNQSSSLVASSDSSGVQTFQTIEMRPIASPSSGPVFSAGALLNLGETTAYQGSTPVLTPQSFVTVPSVLGTAASDAARAIAAAGLMPVTCLDALGLPSSVAVLVQDPEAGHQVLVGSTVRLIYSGCGM